MNTTQRRAAGEAMSEPERTADQFAVHLLPSAYAIRVSGDCLTPLFFDGQRIEVHRDDPIHAGDFVVLFFRSHVTLPNGWGALLKRLVAGPEHDVAFPYDHRGCGPAPSIIVEQVNPPKMYRIACSDILAMHRCAGTIDASRCYRTTLEEMEA